LKRLSSSDLGLRRFCETRSVYAEGEYDLAAFSIEQHCQLMLKYKLLLRTGAYPRTRPLIRLVRELAKVAEGPRGCSRT
jgi:HEPN domain-containing protein